MQSTDTKPQSTQPNSSAKPEVIANPTRRQLKQAYRAMEREQSAKRGGAVTRHAIAPSNGARKAVKRNIAKPWQKTKCGQAEMR